MCRFASIAAACFVLAPSLCCAAAAEMPSISEILDRYADTQRKFKSFIIKQRDVITSSEGNEKCRYEERNEIRSDGKRVYYRMDTWGRFGGNRGEVSKEKPYYRTFLYDGEKTYYHSQFRNGAEPDMIYIDPEPGEKSVAGMTRFCGEELQGKMSWDGRRIDALFRDANSTVRVREKPERVGGSDCYVIDAKTNRGKYTVWIDPDHDYNIAKAEVSATGDEVGPKGSMRRVYTVGMRILIRDVRFKKIGGLWVPIEATTKSAYGQSDGSKGVMTRVYKRTEVIVKPDHDALGSFVPKFPNGSSVRVSGIPRTVYTWQDGKYLNPRNMDELRKNRNNR
jgi:hypothetical protein